MLTAQKNETNFNVGYNILKVSDTTLTDGIKFDIGARTYFHIDTQLALAVEGQIGYFSQYDLNENVRVKTNTVSGRIGLTDTHSIYVLAGASWYWHTKEIAPHVKFEIRPFDKFIWNRVNWVFNAEVGAIKNTQRSESPTGYISLATGITFKIN